MLFNDSYIIYSNSLPIGSTEDQYFNNIYGLNIYQNGVKVADINHKHNPEDIKVTSYEVLSKLLSVVDPTHFDINETNLLTLNASAFNILLTPATTTELGGIKVGANLTIDINGVLNASGGTGGGVGDWGSIGGDIADQTDLANALALKANIASPSFTGNVGIGTAAPSQMLHIYKSGNTTNLISFGNDEWHVGNVNTADFKIYRGSTAQLYITSTGNVGIGTSSPGVLFHVLSKNNLTNSFARFSALNLTQALEIHYNGIRSGGTNAAVPLYLDSKSTEHIIMQTVATGNVGIGTTSPSGKLSIQKADGAASIIQLWTNDGGVNNEYLALYNNANDFLLVSNKNNTGTIKDFHIGMGGSDTVATSAKLTILSSGNVGIGTTTPAYKLTVNGIFSTLNTTNTAITNYGGLTKDTYASQTTGYRISAAGEADFRYIYADELHVKSFIADLEQALAGGQIVSKSVAKIAADFTVPAAGATSSLVVEEFAGFTGAVFVDGDMIRIRQFVRANNTTLTVSDIWGTVVYVSRDGSSDPSTQTFTFTRSANPNAGTGSGTVKTGTLALDYGTTGNGYYEVTAVDGLNGANSPYAQFVTWATHPHGGLTVKARIGNLAGITDALMGALTGYGLYSENTYLTGRLVLPNAGMTNEGATSSDIRIYAGAVYASRSSAPFRVTQGGAMTATSGVIGGWSINSTSIYTGTEDHSGYTANAGDITFYSNGSDASIHANNFYIDTSGNIYAQGGTIGGWTLSSTTFSATNITLSSAGSITAGTSNDVAVMSSADATYRFWCGNASASSAPFRITKEGVLTAESVDSVFNGTPVTSGDFRGSVRIKGNDIWENTQDNDNYGVLRINYNGYNEGTTRYRMTIIGSGRGASVAVFSGWDYSSFGLHKGLDIRMGSLKVPSLTTTERNALDKDGGMIVYDTDLSQFCGVVYEGSDWRWWSFVMGARV